MRSRVPEDPACPLSPLEVDELGFYNREAWYGRGWKFSLEYHEKMAAAQAKYDAWLHEARPVE